MPKVVHMTSVHKAFDTRIFHKECKSLAKAGHEVVYIVPHNVQETVDGVRIHPVPETVGRLGRMTHTVWQVYRAALQEDAEIYHFHDPELIPVGLLLKYKGKKVIYDSHEDYPADILSKYWIPLPARKLISNIFSLVERFAAKRLDAIITVNQEIALRFQRYNSNVVILYNYPILQSDFTRKPKKKPKFVWLGLFCAIRSSEEIHQAVADNEKILFDVIGPVHGINWQLERVSFKGTLPQKEAYERASGYMAGLVTYLPEPNHINALPNKLFEYMSLGVAVIASNFPKWRQIIEDARCGLLVNPTDPSSIAGAMKWMLENQEETVRMGENGLNAVRAKYNWEAEKEKLINIYKRLN